MLKGKVVVACEGDCYTSPSGYVDIAINENDLLCVYLWQDNKWYVIASFKEWSHAYILPEVLVDDKT